MRSLVLRAVVVASLLSGCPGSKDHGPLYLDLGRADLAPSPDFGIRPDIGVRPDGPPTCSMRTDGHSCEGGEVCPSGLKPSVEGDGKCRCRVACDPRATSQCGEAICDRVCIQLYASNNQPLEGQGTCQPDPRSKQGEPCAPAACRDDLVCAGASAEKSFCRGKCDGPGQCPGYKMVCSELDNGVKVCTVGENPGGPAAGASCSVPDVYCQAGLICDPATKTCAVSCNDDGAGAPCASGTCQRIEDPATKILLGLGCK